VISTAGREDCSRKLACSERWPSFIAVQLQKRVTLFMPELGYHSPNQTSDDERTGRTDPGPETLAAIAIVRSRSLPEITTVRPRAAYASARRRPIPEVPPTMITAPSLIGRHE
jgi:hypothetical protein